MIGRFVTADTVVQNFSDPQTLNRYTYCRNNPLIYTDPNGHIFGFGIVESIIFGAIVGGVTSAATGGDVAMGIVTGAISGGIFWGAGEVIANYGVTAVVAHSAAGMMSGGINAGLTGGDVGMGMLTGGIAGGFGEFAGGYIPDNPIAQFAGRSVVGGITGGMSSVMYGGSFGDGFVYGMRTAAIGYLANHMAHETWDSISNFSAGFGDALLLGFGDELRGLTASALGLSNSVDTSSMAYKAGSWTSFAFGASRLGYAGLAKAGSIFASSGRSASIFRSSLRGFFRANIGKNWRQPNLIQYKSDAALRVAAGRTNLGVNLYGAGVAGAGASGAN